MAGPANVTPDQAFQLMPSYFVPAQAQNADGTVQYHLSGPQGGEWWLKIANGTCTTGKGTIANPSVTVNADAQEYVRILLGQESAETALAQGRLKVVGDVALAQRMVAAFRPYTG
jgi:putative sterol carrier protein